MIKYYILDEFMNLNKLNNNSDKQKSLLLKSLLLKSINV